MMKKFGLLAVAMFMSLSLSAQFCLTEKGFVDSLNTQRRFIVVEFPGKTQQDIYNLCLENIQASEDLFYTETPCDSITLTQQVPNAIWNSSILGSNLFMDICFSVTFQFRDGRARVDSPTILTLIFREEVKDGNRLKTEYSYYWLTPEDRKEGNIGGSTIYNRNGQVSPKNEKVKRSLENFINTYVNDMLTEKQSVVLPENNTATKPDEEW